MQPNSPPQSEESIGRSVTSVVSKKIPRRLACRRCNRQKLQCRWEEESDQTCIRCRRASAVCTSSVPRRLGRPTGSYSRESQVPSTSSQNQDRWERQETHPLSNPRELHGPKSPIGDVISQYPHSSEPMSPFLQWPASSTSSLPRGDQTQPFHNNHPNDNYIWPHVDLGVAAPVLNFVPAFTPFNAPQETTTGYSEIGDQGELPSSGNSASDVSQDEFMHELWDLHLLLQDQLKQIRTGPSVEYGSTTGGDTEGGHRRRHGVAFPVDDVLTNTQTFVDLLRTSKHCRQQDLSRHTSEDWTGVRNLTGMSSALADGRTASPLEASTPQSPNPSAVNRAIDLDTPTICAMVSCYARIVDIYNETFHYLAKLLRSGIRGEPVQQPVATLPQFQFGKFQLKGGNILQTTITARIILHGFQCVEKSMGIERDREAVVGVGDPPSTGSAAETEGDAHAGSPGGGSHKGDKVLDVVLALERDGPGGLTKSVDLLRRNMKAVRELLMAAR
ncbi:hypothetical protein NUW58_g1159 [Xylaria curta]|uniref:Uncharacterized protein n=1 Tax=Xylaria curta TaxID=42375 RepID=A0ACC1PLJ1_9PEZI|nr:hypothetical protein NUW58_g1159 [Xylaria curta]